MQTFKKLFWVSRPVSWVNTAYPFFVGALVTGSVESASDWVLVVVMTLFFLGPYNLLMYGINDVFDYESDIANPRKGGVEGMREARSFHPTIIRWSVASTLPFVVYFALHSTTAALMGFIAVLFFVVAYSAPVLRFKERPVLDSITSSIHFVGPLVVALLLFGFDPSYMPYVAAFFAWGVASHALGAVQDIVPDRVAGIGSIATVLGARMTIWIVLALYIVAAVLVALQGGTAIIVGIAGLAYVCNALPYIWVTDESSGHVNRAWKRFLWVNYAVGAVVSLVLLQNLL